MSKKKSSKKSASVKGMAADTWDKLEQVFESRVARVLNAMQIPTHDDVQELSTRVEALTRAVEKLGGKPVPANRKKATSKKKAGTRKKPSRKKTSSKKKTSTRKRPSRKKTSSKKKSATRKKPAPKKTSSKKRAGTRSKRPGK